MGCVNSIPDSARGCTGYTELAISFRVLELHSKDDQAAIRLVSAYGEDDAVMPGSN